MAHQYPSKSSPCQCRTKSTNKQWSSASPFQFSTQKFPFSALNSPFFFNLLLYISFFKFICDRTNIQYLLQLNRELSSKIMNHNIQKSSTRTVRECLSDSINELKECFIFFIILIVRFFEKLYTNFIINVFASIWKFVNCTWKK